jgi:hypothetical protein
VGARSLVVVPLRDLADGERVLLPVTGRTEAGETRTLTLVLVTRRDEVDLTARVVLVPGSHPRAEAAEGDDADAVTRMLLASHEPGSQPRLALVIYEEAQIFARAGDVRAWVKSLLRMERYLFVSVLIEPIRRTSRPWRLMRFRLETRCEDARASVELPPPTLMTKAVSGQQAQLHTFAMLMPEGVECVSLTLEEEGPRMLRLGDVRLPR